MWERETERDRGTTIQALSALSCYVSYNVISRREQRCCTHQVQSRRRRRRRTSRRPPESQSPSPLSFPSAVGKTRRARDASSSRVYIDDTSPEAGNIEARQTSLVQRTRESVSSRDCDRSAGKIDSMYVPYVWTRRG